jgi:hypothetical protein
VAAIFVTDCTACVCSDLHCEELGDRGSGARGDFTGDGLPDLVLQSPSGEVAILEVTLDGGALWFGATWSVASTDLRVSGTADLTGDTWPDLQLQHPTSGVVESWRMHRTTRIAVDLFSPSEVVAGGRLVATGNLSGSGTPNLVFVPADGGRRGVDAGMVVVVLSGSQVSQLRRPQDDWPAMGEYALRAVCDLDDDSYDDVVWQSLAAGGNVIGWLMPRYDHKGALGPQPPQPLDGGWTVAGCANFGGPRTADIILQERDGGTVWFAHFTDAGLTTLGTGALDSEWRVVGPR